MAEGAEIAGSKRHTPRCIQGIIVLQLHQKLAIRGKDIHITKTGAKRDKALRFVLFSIGDVKVVTDVLHVERSKPFGHMIWVKSVFTEFDRLEGWVVDRDFTLFQSSDIKIPFISDLRDRRSA